MFILLTQSYWRDEAFSVLLASRPLKEIFGLIVNLDHTPPFFYYLQHAWIGLFGSSEIAVRALSFLFYGLIIYFIYKLTRSRLIALAAALNPYLWLYAWEARHYSAFAALVLGGVYFYLEKKPWPSAIFWALSLVTHNFAWLYFLTFLVLTREKKLLPALAAGLAWLPWLWRQTDSLNQGMWIERQHGWFVFKTLKIFFTGDVAYPVQNLFWLAAIVLLIISVYRLVKTKPAPRNLILLTALIPPTAIYLESYLWVPLYLERYLLPSVPLLIIGLGLSLKPWRWSKYPAITYLFLALVAIGQISGLETKPAMKLAATNIAQQIRPEENIVVDQPINYLEMNFYLAQLGLADRLYSRLYPGENQIPEYVGVELVKPQAEILAVPADKPFWLVKPDGGVVKYE